MHMPSNHNVKAKNFNSLGPRLKKTYLDKMREQEVLNQKVPHLAPPPMGQTVGHNFLGRL
jgi:hypothetical protein